MLADSSPVPFEYFPAVHFVHDVTATDSAYVPAAQSVQTDRPFSYFPAGHAAEILISQIPFCSAHFGGNGLAHTPDLSF